MRPANRWLHCQINQSNDRSTNQITDQLIKSQITNRITNQPINHKPANQITAQPIKSQLDQSNKSTNQSSNDKCTSKQKHEPIKSQIHQLYHSQTNQTTGAEQSSPFLPHLPFPGIARFERYAGNPASPFPTPEFHLKKRAGGEGGGANRTKG